MGMTLFYPAQGFFNFLIYIRPRYMRYRKKHPEWSLFTVAKETLLRAIRGTALGTATTVSTTTRVGGISATCTGSDDGIPPVTQGEETEDDEDYKLGTPLEEAEDEFELDQDDLLDEENLGVHRQGIHQVAEAVEASTLAEALPEDTA